MDTYAPPQGQAAIYNRLTCPKQWKLYPKYIHERVNFFENQMLCFFKDGIVRQRPHLFAGCGFLVLPGAAFWFAVENSDFMCYNFLILVYSMQMGGKEGVSCPLCNQKKQRS